jgi:hypothetical protein
VLLPQFHTQAAFQAALRRSALLHWTMATSPAAQPCLHAPDSAQGNPALPTGAWGPEDRNKNDLARCDRSWREKHSSKKHSGHACPSSQAPESFLVRNEDKVNVVGIRSSQSARGNGVGWLDAEDQDRPSARHQK